MNRLGIIAVCSRDRPISLARCLESLAQLDLIPTISLKLLVVDNSSSPEQSARILIDMKEQLSALAPELIHEPKAGIPNARNRALEFARELRADTVLFLDDDQTVAPNWAEALCRVQEEEGCDVVKCDVRWVFEVPRKFQEFFEPKAAESHEARWRYSTYVVPTNGVLITRRLWDEWGLRFDEAFPLTGGTDIEFFARAWRKGAKLVHTSETYATEFCDAGKQTASWLVRRAFRIGNTEALMRLKGQTRIHCFGKGIWWIPYYAVVAVMCLPRPTTSFKYFLKTVKGAGLIFGALGVHWEEYRKVVGS